MKKSIIITVILLLIIAAVGVRFLSRPAPLTLASQAEARGNYAVALEHFVSALFSTGESLPYPDKNKVISATEAEWAKSVESYLAWVSYPLMQPPQDFSIAVNGIFRCTSFVENVNFITARDPRPLEPDSLAVLWRDPFFRERKNDFQELGPGINRAMKDTVSVLAIRAMNGYIYTARLYDIQTGKGTDFVLYPNSSVSLLIKPRRYLLVCSSEVQFTDGLSGKTWRSPQNVVALDGPQQTSLWRVTLRTRVGRNP